MKTHIMLALGILLCAVFGIRLTLAVLTPGIGVTEAYLAGGLFLGGWLIKGGLAEWRYSRAQSS